MNHIKKILSLFTVSLLLAACGGGASQDPGLGLGLNKTISGQVQQGNILGAKVFLDLNGNGVKEPAEPAAISTVADGKFVLPLTADDVAKITPASKIVSENGVDTTTLLEAGLLVSDLPAIAGETATKNITPMTTLVAMTPDAQKGKLKGVLGTLGLKDDALIENSTPAVIALTKSCEAAFSSIHKSALASKGKIVATAVTQAAAAKIGEALAGKTAAEITDTEILSTTLSEAAGTAISGKKTELGLDDHQVTGMVDAIKISCKGVADLVKGRNGGKLSTEDHLRTESEIMNEIGEDIKHTVDAANTEIELNHVPLIPVLPTAKTATVAFTSTATAVLPGPLQGMTIFMVLPVGTTVATADVAGNISKTALVIGSAVTNPTASVSGTFSAATRTATITVLSPAGAILTGEFAKLTVDFMSSAVLAPTDFTAPTLMDGAGPDAVGGTFGMNQLINNLQVARVVTFN